MACHSSPTFTRSRRSTPVWVLGAVAPVARTVAVVVADPAGTGNVGPWSTTYFGRPIVYVMCSMASAVSPPEK